MNTSRRPSAAPGGTPPRGPDHDTDHDADHARRRAASRRRIARLAQWLDGLVAVPGTRLRIGIDSIIGLIPGVGDVAGVLLGGVILLEGVRAGAPNPLVLRMLANTLLDGLFGAVPVLGDLFDFAFRSNARNARLLLEHLDADADAATAPRAPVRRGAPWLLLLLLLLPLAVLSLAVYGMVVVFQHLYH